ncbi:unnamed protein product [Mytilus edulis]|uniref:DUF5641 domain-containing protein n=1 Tax=Mytilus edulis TaxID=6550 RepID=A0A8S3V1J2_MYTED|nr:unnamed protein product [Mytilus edulis]
MSSDPGSLMAFQRERKLNPKGQEQYTLQTEKYLDKLRKLKRDIDSYIFSIDVNHLPDQQQVRQIRQDVIDRFYAFTQESTRFILFLQGTRTKESNQEESGHRLIVQSLKSKVDNFIAIIDEHLHNPNVSKKEKKNSVKSNPQLASAMKLAKQASVKSSPTVKKERKSSVKSHRVSKKSDLDYHSTKTRRSSLESFTSHASEMLVKEQVKLEAAKVRLKYTEQEQELTRQKAALDANLEKLVREREVDEAESKVRTIQEALQGSGEDSSTENSDVNDDFVFDRTEQFVIQDSYERLSGKDKILDTDSKLNDVTIIQTVADVHATHDDCNNNKVNKIVQDIKPVQTINVVKSGQMMKTGPELTKKNVQNVHYGKIIDTVQETNHDKTLNAEAPVFIPSTKEVNMCDEFSRFMVRKELVFSQPNSQQRPRKTGDSPVHVSTRITQSEDLHNGPKINSSSHQNPESHLVDSLSCPIHGTSHTLNMCRGFRLKPISERKDFLKKNGLCYRCCGPKKHLSKNCTETVKCIICKSNRHPSALHIDVSKSHDSSDTGKSHGGEETVENKCTQPIQSDVSIELLIGRDLISSHYVLDHRIGKDGLPYAQKLPLGWVILGETCLGKVHYPDIVHVHKTHVLEDGRATFFKPCEYELKLKSDVIFTKTPYDENIGLAVEDKDFLDIMDANFEQDKNGQWTVPLPFKVNRQPLQSNHGLALKRAKSFDYSLSKDERKAKHAATLRNTTWFRGPSFLLQEIDLTSKTDHNLVDPELDREVRPEIKTLKTTSVESKPLESVSSRFDRYSEWRKLVSAINCLRSKIKHYKSVKTLKSNTMNVVEQLLETERFIVKEVQKEGFQEDIDSLMGCNKRLPRNTEVTAIVNNRPLTCVSYDSESPSVITPSLLLTQKTADDTCPFPDFEKKDSIRHHWKYVQFLAQQFWAKWRQEYLHSLQVRPKWQTEEQNVKVGTVVLMKDNNCARNYWPTGIVERVFPSEDGKIRKVELRIIRDGQPVTYVRPISQIVLLVEPE